MSKKKDTKSSGGKGGSLNITYLIGLLGAIAVCIFGMITKIDILADPIVFEVDPGLLANFFDASSIFITIGCTVFVVVASFPGKMLGSMPKHFQIILKSNAHDPMQYIDRLVELAQTARKSGLLSLEEKANEEQDPFFKQAIMLLVDAYDADKIRAILENDIECMSARHEDCAAMYDKASSVAPAFGMVGTLVGLINMLKNMNLADGSSSIGSDMGTALITTLYGCILAHMVFGPIATLLRNRDSEEVLCKMIIVEGIMSIQAGENPKFLREQLLTYMSQKGREMANEEDGNGKKGKKK